MVLCLRSLALLSFFFIYSSLALAKNEDEAKAYFLARLRMVFLDDWY
jgi:hypothetical protein